MSSKKTCSSVLMSSKKHVLLFLCLQKKTCSSVLMSSKKHVLLLREQQEHAFKAFTEVLYRLIGGFAEVLCNTWNID